MTSTPIPKNKRVLNMHVTVDEHAFLKMLARRSGVTVTAIVRGMVRANMAMAGVQVAPWMGAATATRGRP